MSNRVDDFLAHYASKYYDPVKAREYYLRTRELKGREAAGPELSNESKQRQAEANAYVTDQIITKRDSELKANDEAHRARMEKLQADATATRERIVQKLKDRMDKINKQLKIPANANPKLRAFLEKQRASQLNTAVGKAKEDMAGLQADIRATIDVARKAYESSRKNIIETASQDLETEKKNIREQVR